MLVYTSLARQKNPSKCFFMLPIHTIIRSCILNRIFTSSWNKNESKLAKTRSQKYLTLSIQLFYLLLTNYKSHQDSY